MWQFDGQWFRISDQESAEAGRVPSCGSVPDPEKAITSPTLHMRLPDGALIVAVGGVFPTVMVIGPLTLDDENLDVSLKTSRMSSYRETT